MFSRRVGEFVSLAIVPLRKSPSQNLCYWSLNKSWRARQFELWLTQGFIFLVSNSGYDPLAEKCLLVTTQASLVMTGIAARSAILTQEIKGV